MHIIPDAQKMFCFICNCATDFHNEPAPRMQGSVSLRNQPGDDLQSCWSGENGAARLEFPDFELHLVFFRLAYVGRIGNYEIEGWGETVEQIGLMKLNSI